MTRKFSGKTHHTGWWDTIPPKVKLPVRKTITEIERGKGIPHEEVKEMYPQWFKR